MLPELSILMRCVAESGWRSSKTAHGDTPSNSASDHPCPLCCSLYGTRESILGSKCHVQQHVPPLGRATCVAFSTFSCQPRENNIDLNRFPALPHNQNCRYSLRLPKLCCATRDGGGETGRACHFTLGPAVNGSVYCYDKEAGKYRFWRFNLKANKWSEVPVPAEMMQGIVSFKLVEHWGRLLMGASSRETTGPQTMDMKQLEGIKVWELSVVDSVIQRESSAPAGDAEPTARNFVETTYRWNMLAEMEQNFFKHLRRRFEDNPFLDGYMKNPGSFDLVAVDHCIYISINGTFFPRGDAGRFQNLVLFDTLDRSWSWVTPPEIVLPSGYCSYRNAMSFVPRKTALP